MTATSARSYSKREEGILATLVQQEIGDRPIFLNPAFGDVAETGTVAGYTVYPAPDATSSYLRPQLEALPSETTAEAILEIRRRGGLTWEEIANLFRVSRRSAHNWANGRPTTAQHEHSIRQILSIIRRLDRGSQEQNRNRLLTGVAGRPSLFELLQTDRFHDVVALLGPTPVTQRRRRPLSQSALAVRRPPAPGQLLEAEQETPRIPASRTRIANAVRTSGKQAT